MKPASARPARDRLPLAAGALVLWVAIAPWLWGYAGSGPAVANHIFIVFAFGPLTLLIVALRPAAFVIVASGLWVAVSPWLLGYATNHSAWLSDLITGTLLTIVGARAAAVRAPRRVPEGGKRRQPAPAPAVAETTGSHP
jgi:SPW repeat